MIIETTNTSWHPVQQPAIFAENQKRITNAMLKGFLKGKKHFLPLFR